MRDSDDFIEVLKASITYGISNPAMIVIYGILYIIVLALFSMGFFVVALVALFVKSWIALVLFVLLLILLLAISWLSMGYSVQCLRSILRGGERMPGLFDDVSGLVVEGVKGFIVSLLVLVPVLGLYLVSAVLMLAGIWVIDRWYSILLICIGMALILIVMVIAIPLTFICLIQLTIYADTGSLRKGLNPLESIELIRRNAGEAAMAAGLLIALYAINMAVTMVLSWTCIGYLVLPFVILPLFAAILYVTARFYRRATGQSATPAVAPAV